MYQGVGVVVPPLKNDLLPYKSHIFGIEIKFGIIQASFRGMLYFLKLKFDNLNNFRSQIE